MDVEKDKEKEEEEVSYKEKLLVLEGPMAFSAFDGRCYGIPDKAYCG